MRTIISPLYLTKSKTRTELLTLFFLNRQRSYYLRELQRKFGFSPGLLSRELRLLASEGLLEREERGREVFYKINQVHPLYRELKSIIEKTSGIPERFSSAFQKLDEVKQAFLYGSIAKGTMNAQSDIDCLIVGQETEKVRNILRQLESKFDRNINATAYSETEFEQKKKDKSEFIYEVLKSPFLQIKPRKELLP